MNRDATLSTIKIDNLDQHATLYGIEKPWRDNRRFVSCIPAGNYVLQPFNSKKFGKVWCFITVGVPRFENRVVRNKNDAAGGKRYACLIHAGNFGADVQGCLSPGLEMQDYDDNLHQVVHSRNAMQVLRTLLPDYGIHTAEIRWFS